ncbi:MAG: DUF802 domain-containing protein [Phycisphaerales bacterium]|nr:DUF802 domain-containing protein [Phycisphaerales bacterium]
MKSRGAQHRAGAAATAAAAAFGVAAAALAQDPAPPEEGGPIVVGERQEQLDSFVIQRFRTALEFLYRYRTDERKRPGEPTTRETEEIIRPSVEFSTDAYIVHPNFIQLSFTGGLQLDHTTLDSTTLNLNEDTTTLDTNYDFRAFILGESSLPVTLYSRRSQTNIDRLFGPSLDSTLTEHGGIAQFVNDRAPTTIQLFHRDQQQTDAGGQTDFGVVQDTFDVHSNIRVADRQSLSLDYTLDSIRQSGAGRRAQDFIRHDATALHVLDFGDRDSLRSQLRLFDQSGDSQLRRISLDESLRLYHSETLQTRYDLFYENQSRADSNQDFLRGNFNVRHRLFGSLVTSANIGASTLNTDGFTSNEYYGDVTFDYTKKVPYGIFTASASVSENIRDNGPRGTPLRIFDESRTFNDPAPITIARQNILPGSIVITDISGLTFYDEGLDYTLMVFFDRVEIRRVVGGSIVDGQTVLIDYTIGPESANTITTTGLGFSARYSINDGFLNGLGLYMRYLQRDASIDSPRPSEFILDDSRDLIFGADYITGPLSLNAEYETYDSVVSPFDATRFEARYVHTLGRFSSLSLLGSYQMIDYPSLDNHVDLATVTASWNQQLTNQLRLNAQLVWRDERDDLQGHTQGFEQRINLNWRYRQTEIYVSGRNSIFDSSAEERLAQSVEVGFRRTF